MGDSPLPQAIQVSNGRLAGDLWGWLRIIFMPDASSSSRRPLCASLFTLGVGTGLVLLHRWRLLPQRKFEYGSLELTDMTSKAAKAVLGVQAGPKKKKRGKSAALSESLIPEVLQDLEESGGITSPDAVSPDVEVDLRAQALSAVGAPPFRRFLKDQGIPDLTRDTCSVLQLNIGLYCNQACTHCHVESSPLRKEMMPADVANQCLKLLHASPHVTALDLTGGAPEMNESFRLLVEGASEIRKTRPELKIIDRCNLTVLLEPGYTDLPEFFVKHRVSIIASLPSYDADQTDRQRGKKVFAKSIEALRILNDHGYGKGDKELTLDLVFNPPAAFLPPKQELLEAKYKKLLTAEHGVQFDRLITLANMPVKRFFDHLNRQGTLEGYMDLLVRNFNPDTVPSLMCLNHVNVRFDGRIYDCDFNQQLDLSLGRTALTVFDLETLDDQKLKVAPIQTRAHCFGCTAAQGSS